jgi:hypothetical protein
MDITKEDKKNDGVGYIHKSTVNSRQEIAWRGVMTPRYAT